MRECGCACEVGEESSKYSGTVGYGGGHNQNFSCFSANIGYGRSHKSYNDERNEKSEELAEQSVESHEYSSKPFGKYISATNTEGNGKNYLKEQSYLNLLFFRHYAGC